MSIYLPIEAKIADPFCRAETKRGKYTWVCYQQPGHNGPHRAGNSANSPIYRTWFDVLEGDAS